MSKTLLFVDAKSRVEYEGEKVYVDGVEESFGDVDRAKEHAQSKAWEKMSEIVIQYTTTFKNLAVLTAAGTSMDNGANHGKTRDGLWDYCKDEIEVLLSGLSIRSDVLKSNLEITAHDKDIEEFLSLAILSYFLII